MRSENDNTSLLGGNPKRFSLKQKLLMIIGAAVVIAAIVIGVSVALYYHSKDKGAGLPTTISVDNIIQHLKAFNSLATELGNGSRSVVHAYDASADYIMQQLSSRKDFCDIQTQQFYVPIYVQLATPTLGQVSPLNVNYVSGKDFSGLRYGGNGTYDITASTIVVANYGCNMSDFQGNLNLQIAVIFDGNCTQYQKALNAEQANASAILIVNGKGNALANWRVRSLGWNSSNPLVQIPVLGLTYSLGLTLQEQPGTILHLTTSTQVTIESTFNVLCLTKKGSDKSILVMGSHLDSVPEGPGINDNASGSSSVLEIALEIEKRKLDLKSKILFAWWGAEEIGLLGSRHFVSQVVAQSQPGYTLPSSLDQANFLPSLSTANILLNLNFDMLGSPNFVRQVYNSTAQTPRVNDASFRIHKLFDEYFDSQTKAYEIVPMSGGSDYLPFIENGIPAGALATGAGALKTVEERVTFEGLANAALDPCYHLSCDTIENIDQGVLSDMARAAAYVVQHLSSHENLNTFLYN